MNPQQPGMGTPPFTQDARGTIYDAYGTPCDNQGRVLMQQQQQQPQFQQPQQYPQQQRPQYPQQQRPMYQQQQSQYQTPQGRGGFVQQPMYQTPQYQQPQTANTPNANGRYTSENTTVKEVVPQQAQVTPFMGPPVTAEPVAEVKLNPLEGNEFEILVTPKYIAEKANIGGGYYKWEIKENKMDEHVHTAIYNTSNKPSMTTVDKTDVTIEADEFMVYVQNSKRALDVAKSRALESDDDSVLTEAIVLEPLSFKKTSGKVSKVYDIMVTDSDTLVKLAIKLSGAISDEVDPVNISSLNEINGKLTRAINLALEAKTNNAISFDSFITDMYDLHDAISKMTDVRKRNICEATLSDVLHDIKMDAAVLMENVDAAEEVLEEYVGTKYTAIPFITRLAILHTTNEDIAYELTNVGGEFMAINTDYTPLLRGLVDTLGDNRTFKDNSTVLITVNDGSVYRVSRSKLTSYVVKRIK